MTTLRDDIGEPPPYALVTDDDGHTYVIPDARREEWEDLIYGQNAYGEPNYYGKEWPSWARTLPGGEYWVLIDEGRVRDTRD